MPHKRTTEQRRRWPVFSNLLPADGVRGHATADLATGVGTAAQDVVTLIDADAEHVARDPILFDRHQMAAVRELVASFSADDMAEMVGAKIVLDALSAPLEQIAENAGFDGAVVLDKVQAGTEDFGFNAASGKYEHLIKAGIIDPTKVARVALMNAVSVASMILITEAIVADAPKKEGSSDSGHGHGGGMGMGEDF